LWLIVALLWAPIWGQWHGIAHQVQQAVAAPAAAAPVVGDMDEGHAPGSALCLVLDHLGHASALSAWPLQVSLLLLTPSVPAGLTFPAVVARLCCTPPARAPPTWT
jgi:Zn-dependent protease